MALSVKMTNAEIRIILLPRDFRKGYENKSNVFYV